MRLSPENDVTAMRIHLKELQSQFDKAMREGESFTTMKEIHMQIKELESHLKVLEWSGQRSMGNDPSSRTGGETRYRHIKEPPPLL